MNGSLNFIAAVHNIPRSADRSNPCNGGYEKWLGPDSRIDVACTGERDHTWNQHGEIAISRSPVVACTGGLV